MFNTAADAGAFAGPLIGVALLAVDFRLVAAVAATVFALLTVAQLLVLPEQRVERPADGVLRSWSGVVRNGRFVAFTLCGSAYFTLYNQIYLVFPLEVRRVTGTPAAVSALFAVSTVLGILLYVRVASWAGRRWAPGTCVAVGLGLMAAAFVPVAASAALLGEAVRLDLLAGLPVLAGTVVFTLGIALVNPFTMQLLPVVGSERLLGTYYGFFYLVSAVVAAAVSAGVGALLDTGGGRRSSAARRHRGRRRCRDHRDAAAGPPRVTPTPSHVEAAAARRLVQMS